MKHLSDYKEEIHKCSKCGLCQAECSVYKVTGNDCTVSRGQFAMLNGVVKGDLKMTPKINRYLDLCLKCGKCSDFCPAGINAVDIIIAAKHEYYKKHLSEKIKAFIKKYIIFGFIPNFINLFRKNKKSKTFARKVLFFGGCASKLSGDSAAVKILNKMEIESINPNFPCCGISLLSLGDLKGFESCIKKYIEILKKYDIKEIVTTCSSCEKTLKDYIKYTDNPDDINFLKELKISNIYEYIRNSELKLKLKTPKKITYHKPCGLKNFEDVIYILNNTENMEYIEMNDYDTCCGLNGLDKFSEYKIFRKIYSQKAQNIINTEAKTVLTSCLGCQSALKAYSYGKYKVYDLIDFIGKFSE